MAEVLRMPEVAANTVEATLESWNVEIDAPYAAGELIATVETEKAVVEVPAESDGVLLRVLVDPGQAVAVGTPIAIWGTSGEPKSEVDALLAKLGAGEQPASVDAPSSVPANGVEGERIFASPLARRIAKDLALDLGTIVGTGPRGRIRRRDVEAAAAQSVDTTAPGPADAVTETPSPAAAAPAEATYVDIPVSRMRHAIARRLTESKQNTPHFYLRGSARVDELLELRRTVNDGTSVKVSVNDLLVKAIACAHTEVPAMNVQWNDTSIRQFSTVDVSVAVATEGGLVTPVVRGVDTMTMAKVAAATRDLIARAKDRRLRQDELEGGTISISNLGMYGTEEFAAIINPPQAAILAVGAARQEAVVSDGAVTVTSVLHLTLAVDHRSVDGATAAEWMAAFVDVLEHPLQILL